MSGQALGVFIGLFVLVAIIYFVMRSSVGVVPVSHLICPNCGKPFDYSYIPGMSITSLRWMGSRYIKCPTCGQSSWFNLRHTQVDPKTHPNDHPRIGPG